MQPFNVGPFPVARPACTRHLTASGVVIIVSMLSVQKG